MGQHTGLQMTSSTVKQLNYLMRLWTLRQASLEQRDDLLHATRRHPAGLGAPQMYVLRHTLVSRLTEQSVRKLVLISYDDLGQRNPLHHLLLVPYPPG